MTVVLAAGVVLRLDERGTVWRSVDAGFHWAKVLPRSREDRSWDLVDWVSVPQGEDEEDLPPPVPTTDALAADLERRVARALWCDADACWVVRADGAFRSFDEGAHWERADPPPVPSRPARIPSGGSSRIARLLPEVAVDGWLADGLRVEWPAGDGVLRPWRAEQSAAFEVHLTLVFTPPTHAAPQADRTVDVVELGGRRIVADPGAGPALRRALVREIAADRGARDVARAELVALRARWEEFAPATGDLLARVQQELARQAVDAQLILSSQGEGR